MILKIKCRKLYWTQTILKTKIIRKINHKIILFIAHKTYLKNIFRNRLNKYIVKATKNKSMYHKAKRSLKFHRINFNSKFRGALSNKYIRT